MSGRLHSGSTFEARLEAVRPRLYNHCFRLCGGEQRDIERAEDLVQDTLIRAYVKRDSIETWPGKEEWNLARWCEVVATRIWLKQLVKAGRRPEEVSLSSIERSEEMEEKYLQDVTDLIGRAVADCAIDDILARKFLYSGQAKHLTAPQIDCISLMISGLEGREAAQRSGLTYEEMRCLKRRVQPGVSELAAAI
jgi:DNA-directed RNA polymerase specialized sigma24 family protein